MTWQAAVAAGATAGAGVSLAGTLAYLRDVRAGRTVPHRGCWLVWTTIGLVALVTQAAGGGRWALLVLAAQAGGNLAVLALSVRHGTAGVTRSNLALLAVAAAGILAWTTSSDPTAAAAGAALADGAGLVAIVPKVLHDPDTETAATYALAGVSGLLTALAVPADRLSLLLFPGYFCLANTAMGCLIAVRRRHGTG